MDSKEAAQLSTHSTGITAMTTTLDAVSRHPLVVLAFTAIVSGYLVPRLTRWWQDNQKDIDARAQLASEATSAVIRIIVATQIAERQSGTQEAFDNAYKQWEVDRAVLETRAAAYFRDRNIVDDWRRLADSVTNVYVLAGVVGPRRDEHLRKMRLDLGLTEQEREALLHVERKSEGGEAFHTYFNAWWRLREVVLDRTSAFARKILRQRTQFLI